MFDFVTQKWNERGSNISAGWQSWSRDSKYIYYLGFQPNTGGGVLQGIFRVAVSSNKPEEILSLKDFRPAGTYGAWLSLTAEDDPLVLRDAGPPEIYALAWDAP